MWKISTISIFLVSTSLSVSLSLQPSKSQQHNNGSPPSSSVRHCSNATRCATSSIASTTSTVSTVNNAITKATNILGRACHLGVELVRAGGDSARGAFCQNFAQASLSRTARIDLIAQDGDLGDTRVTRYGILGGVIFRQTVDKSVALILTQRPLALLAHSRREQQKDEAGYRNDRESRHLHGRNLRAHYVSMRTGIHSCLFLRTATCYFVLGTKPRAADRCQDRNRSPHDGNRSLHAHDVVDVRAGVALLAMMRSGTSKHTLFRIGFAQVFGCLIDKRSTQSYQVTLFPVHVYHMCQ